MPYDSRIARRRFLKASAAAVAGIAAGANLSQTAPGEAAGNSKVTWLVRTGPTENAWEQKVAIPHFQKQHPEISVQPLIVPGAQFDVKLTNLVSAGTPPDVWSQWGPSDFVDYSYRGLTADITPFLKNDMKDYADFYPGALDYGKWNHRQTGIPLMLGGTYTFYNMDLFDKANQPYPTANWDDKSWNWNSMITLAKKLTKSFDDPNKAIYGVIFVLGCLEEHVWLWGGDVWDKQVYTDKGIPTTSHWNTPAAMEAVQALADLTYVHKVSPPPAVVSALAGTSDAFLTGRVAMMMTGIWGFWTYKDAPFRWGAAALPGMQSNKDGVYADPWLLSSRSKNPNAAWQFIKYLTTTQGAREYMKATNTPVPHTSLLLEWFKQFKTMKPETLKMLFDGSLKHGYLSVQNDLVAYDRIRDIINQEFNPVLNGHAKAKDVAAGVDQKLRSRVLRRLHA